jgi:hypothetical protein
MADNNITVFQRLTKMFGFPGQVKPEDSPSFNFSREEILNSNYSDIYYDRIINFIYVYNRNFLITLYYII